MQEDELWRARIAEERANELLEYKMIASQQLDSQIERVSASLERQLIANQAHEQHLKELDREIAVLKSILNDLPETKD